MHQHPQQRPRRPDPLAGRSDGTAQRSRTIMIHPEMIIAGITFHLIDRGEAVGVDDGSARKALARLRRRQFSAFVPRLAWESMTDRERLDWMLAVSDTVLVVRADRVALLKRRRE